MIPRSHLAWIHPTTCLQLPKSLKTLISTMTLDTSFLFPIRTLFPMNEKWAPSKAPAHPIWIFLFPHSIYPYWGNLSIKYLLCLQCLAYHIHILVLYHVFWYWCNKNHSITQWVRQPFYLLMIHIKPSVEVHLSSSGLSWGHLYPYSQHAAHLELTYVSVGASSQLVFMSSTS